MLNSLNNFAIFDLFYQNHYQINTVQKSFNAIILLLSIFCFGQKKVLQTKFSSDKITIDGKINEVAWQNVPFAKDFITFEPDNGNVVDNKKRTEVKILYDNDAIYIAAVMFDDEPDKILKEITQRDNIGTSDFFGIFINGFNDGQQDFRFFVTASNGQADSQASDTDGEAFSWDAIWDSKAVVTDEGWVVEIKIPYAALRFSTEPKQTWGLNFFREIRRDRQKYTWNFVDRKIGTFTQQTGILEGIENIKTPTRLFFIPYSSYYLQANGSQKTKGILKGGMDVKYGINDAFTLDAILVPDFGQTLLDQKILNLGPFEQQFNENRPFFTEGIDLFSKGDLLYSRRIGGRPTYELAKNESYTETPSSAVGLVNALKISGRNKTGLGIGVLNAVTETTVASIFDSAANQTRRQIIEPLANFNVTVFDQRFNKNSSIYLINTNVIRDGDFRDANVSAIGWNFNTKANSYSINGNYKHSYINDKIDKSGLSSELNFNKTIGKLRYGFGADITTKDFDINDLGINFLTNFYSLYGNINYRLLNPTKTFNTFNTRLNVYHQFNKETSKVQESSINMNFSASNKSNDFYGMNINGSPLETHDYYDPRVEGRYLINPERIGFGGFFSSNYNRKFAFDTNANISWSNQVARNSVNFRISPRYRFSDQLSMVFSSNYSINQNNKGYVTQINTDKNTATPNDIILGNRDITTFSNSVTGKFSINSNMNFNLNLQHYWSFSENKNFLLLEQNGRFSDYLSPVQNLNQDFSNFNLDFSFVYWFAPGSQMTILYRNNSSNFSRDVNKDFGRNFSSLLNNEALNHVLSISFRYFIDFNQAKNWL